MAGNGTGSRGLRKVKIGMKRANRRIGIRIDMTPMVDIAFLLLIFYMVTTQFKPAEIRSVNLPSSHSQMSLPDKDIINVTVTAGDTIFVDYITRDTIEFEGRAITVPMRQYLEATVETIAKLVIDARILNREAFLVIKADRESSFGTMEGIMKTLQKNQMSRFQIITDLETEI